MSAVAISHDATLDFFDVPAFAIRALKDWQSLAAVIDHTMLRPDASQSQIVQHCTEAVDFGFACVMVNPTWLSLAHALLEGTAIKTAAVVGFPLGASLITSKREEADQVLRLGAQEIDMVINIGALKSGYRKLVEQDIRGVVEVAHDAGAIVKVILETCLLTLEEKILGSELVIMAGADYLKTSTGFSTGGANVHDVGLLRGVAGNRCQVKAAGGIRTAEAARQMIEAGASRLGSSSGVAIVREMGAP